MSGFKNSSLNSIVKQNYYEQIILLLKSCSDLMISSGVKIQNHEEKITAHLHYYYLDDKHVRDKIISNSFPFKFIIESVEKFNDKQNTYDGRTDIKVVSSNWFAGENLKDYFIIECKRIDGTKSLNEKYITQGVARFVVPPIKYQSYHKENIMFGYVVKRIAILANIQKLNIIHKTKLIPYSSKDITFISERSTHSCYMCESEYTTLGAKSLLLSHIFYDFSDIIA